MNLSLTNVPLQYPLKTLENQWFSDVFRRYRSGKLACNGLTKSITKRKLEPHFYNYYF